MGVERTLVLIKPDGVNRKLIGRIITRFEVKGLKLVGLKMFIVSRELAEEHYREHVGKEFYPSLVNFITSDPIVAIAIEGRDAVKVVRNIIGKTDPVEALPGTIRGDFGLDKGKNLIHASDSIESAQRELSLFFKADEILNWQTIDHTLFE